MPTQQEIADAYQPLFDLMQQEHGKILLLSEMDDIINACEIVKESMFNLSDEAK